MKTFSRCSVCKKRKTKRKHIPYGSQLKSCSWCGYCDCNMVDEVNKKKERRKAKQEVKKELDSKER